MTNPDLEGVKSFEITGSNIFAAFYPDRYTKDIRWC